MFNLLSNQDSIVRDLVYELGYTEILWHQCPVDWKIGVRYFSKDWNLFAMVDDTGHYYMFDKSETDKVRKAIGK